MITNGSIIQFARDVFSDALFGSSYTTLSNEWDLFICNLFVTAAVMFTLWLFFKIITGVISIFGG